MGDIDAYSIFTPTCTGNGVTKRLRRKWYRVGHIGQSYDPCTEQHSIATGGSKHASCLSF
ncbi:hypothetical protein HanIR_Chr14g0700951 [Helianthus annuus]|nr:hypothetical protein HanIR_Chr14g0700951 [Helianthus annuus]